MEFYTTTDYTLYKAKDTEFEISEYFFFDLI